MKKFGFIIAPCQTNTILAHNEPKVNFQVGDAEYLTKTKFIRTMANEMVVN